MQKILLVFLLFVLSGCVPRMLFFNGEVDKVMVVRYAPYMKHHRAYFSRNHLKVIQAGKKYLFLHNKKTNDLTVLLHRKNKYLLYNMSNPKQLPLIIKAKANISHTYLFKTLEHKGYHIVKSLNAIGYVVSVSHRRYKGIKTLLIETKEYTNLQALYKKAIASYNASKIKRIKTLLPKPLISNYYYAYKKRSKSQTQRQQLQVIGQKLEIVTVKKPKITTPKKVKFVSKKAMPKKLNTSIEKKSKAEKVLQTPLSTPAITQKTTPRTTKKPYTYYLHYASMRELSNYIANSATKNALSYTQYTMLTQRKLLLEEEKLFEEGSLEELIAAYKVNKNPKYKQRIMSLMKEKQKTQ